MNKRHVKMIIHCGAIDMRKGIYKLHFLCIAEHNASSKRPAFFIFCNKPKTKIKILVMCGTKFHIIQENLTKSKGCIFDWWPDSEAELKRRKQGKIIKDSLVAIVESHGFTI